MNKLICTLALSLTTTLAHAQVAHKGFTFMSYIRNPGGTAVNLSNISVKVQIISNNDCVLMEEDHANVNVANGYLSLTVGDGTRTAAEDPGFSFKEIFDNATVRNALKDINGAACNYTPAAQHIRRARISLSDSGTPVVATFSLRGTAFAVQSENALTAGDAAKLGGKDATEYAQLTSGKVADSVLPNIPAALLPNIDYAKLPVGTGANTVAAGDDSRFGNATKIQTKDVSSTAPTNGQILVYSTGSSSWVPTSVTTGGTVTSVSVSAPLGVTNGSTTPALTITQAATGADGYLSSTDWNTFNGKLSSALADGKMYVGNGSGVATAVTPSLDVSVSNAGAFQVNRIQNNLINGAAVTGGLMKWDAATSTWKGAAFPACTTSQTAYWNSGTDTIACQSISYALSNLGNQAANKVLAGPTTGAAADPTFRSLVSADVNSFAYVNGGNSFGGAATIGTGDANSFTIRTNGTSRIEVESDGKVGINTTSPGTLFEIASNVSGSPLRVSRSDNAAHKASTGYFPASVGSGTPSWAVGLLEGSNNFSVLAYDGTTAITPLTVATTGRVGVSTDTPRGALDVNGVILGKTATSGTGGTVDFAGTNLRYTSDSCGAFAFHNMKDGGSYMFAVQGTSAATCTFTAYSDAGSTALTVKMPPDHGATTASKHTIYNMVVMGSFVYVAWTPGY
ncbi:hypothetical protein [Bdellovibrio reynosensis]|uniref:Cell wall anchor protein n=1 Tax=Bdellovibrio reynosensis TaxID=2835041 RepID=A0ABY4C8E6_9BACT|nr:hypothetical protein [Bdellovibrio reynosensis]UOF00999.1 hypothetical protein MNR06_14960 [Bdellovibrio reynosensis]